MYRIEPPPYSTQTSAIQNEFVKTLIQVFNKKKIKNNFNPWQNSYTKDYNFLIIIMNSAFNSMYSGVKSNPASPIKIRSLQYALLCCKTGFKPNK